MSGWTPESSADTALAALPPQYGVSTLVHSGAHFRVYAGREDSGEAIIVKIPCQPGAGEQESRMTLGLNHPGIPACLDCIDTPHGTIIINQRVTGHTLAHLQSTGRFRHPEKFTAGLLAYAADTLAYLHDLRPAIVHRDICPSNLLLDSQGKLHLVGFIHATDDPRVSVLPGPANIGSAGYVPADQYDEGRASPAADVYALASTFTYLLTGLTPHELPHRGHAPDLVPLGVDPRLAELLRRCMSPNAASRPSASQVARDAREILQSKVPTTPAAARPPAETSPAIEPLNAENDARLDEPTPAAAPATSPTPAGSSPLAPASSPGLATDPDEARPETPPGPALPSAETPPEQPPQDPASDVLSPEGTSALATKASKLDALWQAVLDDPTNPDLHETYAKFAVNSGQYEGAKRYESLEKQPGNVGSIARQYRRKIANGAAARILAAQPKVTEPIAMSKVTKFGLIAGGVGTTLAAVMGQWIIMAITAPVGVFALWTHMKGRRRGE